MSGLLDVGSGCQEVVAVVFVREPAEEEEKCEVNEQLKPQQEKQTYEEILALLFAPLF